MRWGGGGAGELSLIYVLIFISVLQHYIIDMMGLIDIIDNLREHYSL